MKPKIYATGNETLKGEFNISYYIFEKDASFLDWLGRLLAEVFEINGGVERAKTIKKPIEDSKGRQIGEEVYLKNIDKMTDIHEKYENKKLGDENRIDIFYGQNRVYVTLRKSRAIREKFAKFVQDTKEWTEMKKILEIPLYAEKKK